ncbi:MAG: phage portal protein [Anaerolineaceae bacterium]|nr:phage portal protein [Anaerolineaceae bacterium]
MSEKIREFFSGPVPQELRPESKGSGLMFWNAWDSNPRKFNAESAQQLSTVYRCMNILSDDIASLPFQQFTKLETGGSRRVKPDGKGGNIAYLIEVQPNRWLTPFLLKKGMILDLLAYGNAYVWQPAGSGELFPLEPWRVSPMLNTKGERFFHVVFENGSEKDLPDAEVLQLMINPDRKRMIGRSVLSYASDTLNRQWAANETRNKVQGNGLLPTAVMRVNGEIDREAREKVKESYLKAAEGGVAIVDSKIADFQQLTVKATDLQFLESINATEREIANYFGVPEYKLNLGKQSYQSNEQQQLDYLGTTINPYLVQIEQAARLKWLAIDEQAESFFRFERKALLQIDSKTQSEFLRTKIMSGVYSPNEARSIDDMEPYEGGDKRFIQTSMGIIEKDGLRIAGAKEPAE